MKSGKLIVSLGVVFALCGSVSVVAEEKLQTMDAIWNSYGVAQKPARTNHPVQQRTHQLNEKQLVAAAKQKLAREEAVTAKRKLPQKRQQPRQVVQKKPITQLDRQRAAWRAKWLAQQKTTQQSQTHKQTPKTQTQVAANKANPHAKQLPLKKSAAIWNNNKRKQIVKAPQKPLTREQYHERWRQQQLQKQKNVAKTTRNQNAKPHQQARPVNVAVKNNKQPAAIRSLPFDVNHLLKTARLNPHAMSAYVQDVNSPKPLLGFQDTTSRVPASVMKLITSYAALSILGPDYRWPLDVYTRGPIQNGTLNGDLIVKGYGAPEFNQAELKKVLHGIRQKGIRNVNGRVVFDNSYFNVSDRPSFDNKSQSAYNAQPDALLYNERINSFQIRSTGRRVHVTTSTPTHNLKIVNRMRPAKRSCRPKINVSKRGVQTVVSFSGYFARRCGTRSYSRVISRPSEMIYGAMKSMWKRDVGGRLNTQFAMGRMPANAKPLLRTYSRRLVEVLPTISKDSNNVMARQVMLTIGAKRSGHQGTEQNGANAIGTWLVSRGLHFPELRIENGSGLSRHARISARHVGDLLVDAYRSPYRNILMQSLAVAGVDGTMKRRLKKSRVRGRGFFKTGTLRDVRSIAGYVKAADGKTYVMAILHNDPRARSRALRAHDKLIEWVYTGGRSQQLAMR